MQAVSDLSHPLLHGEEGPRTSPHLGYRQADQQHGTERGKGAVNGERHGASAGIRKKEKKKKEKQEQHGESMVKGCGRIMHTVQTCGRCADADTCRCELSVPVERYFREGNKEQGKGKRSLEKTFENRREMETTRKKVQKRSFNGHRATWA